MNWRRAELKQGDIKSIALIQVQGTEVAVGGSEVFLKKWQWDLLLFGHGGERGSQSQVSFKFLA